MKETRELGPDQLKALTHPMRLDILRALRTDGPATATALAERLGESSGATSYHLRQLARHGFVEEDPDRGDRRDRWWRPAFAGHRVETGTWADDPETRAVVTFYEAEIVRGAAQRVLEFLGEQGAGEWSREWMGAADISDFGLRLTPARLRQLADEVHALIESYGNEPAEEGEHVIVQLHAFPRRPKPFGDEA